MRNIANLECLNYNNYHACNKLGHAMIWGMGWNAIRIEPWWMDQRGISQLDAATHWEQVPIRGQDHALWLLGNSGIEVQAMREMLADGSIASSRNSDHLIIKQVAQKLADRQLLLFMKVTKPGVSLPYVPSGAAPGASLATRTVTASPKKAAILPPPRRPASESVSESTPQLVERDFTFIDQDAQAAALRKAAVTGVPFCAVCEELKRKRTATDSSREAA
jgi:hypothetical protein